MKDSSAPAEDRPAAAPWIGPGAMLREARESKRLSTRAVADALHLSTDIVEALEEERFDDLPPLTFVKGYLRAYAKLVELPEEQLMDAFGRLGLEESEALPAINGSAEGGKGATPSAAWLLLILVLALAAGLGWWWYNQRIETGGGAADGEAVQSEPAAPGTNAATDGVSGDDPRGSRTEPSAATERGPDAEAAAPAGSEAVAGAPETGTAESTPDVPQTGVDAPDATGVAGAGGATAEAPDAGTSTSTDALVADGTSSSQSTGVTQAETPAEPASDESAGAGADSPASATTEQTTGADTESTATMTLTVSGESWVDIREATGGRVLYGLISGPAQRTISGKPPFTLVIGEAGAVELRYEGEPVRLDPYTRGDVARFQWPPDS